VAADRSPNSLSTGARRAPWFGAPVTLALLALNVLVFAYQSTLAPEQLELFVLRWAAIPVEIAERADFPPTTPMPLAGTLLSALFIHASLAHLAINMALLALFGWRLERAAGGGRALAIYLAGGLLGGAAQVLAQPHSLVPLVGASGAIAAWMIAAPLLAPGSTAHLLILVAWAAFQAASSAEDLAAINQIGGGPAIWSHLGGLAAGLALGLLLRRSEPPRRQARQD
jgi:membrane associated rhomboid family serine protease